MTRYTEAPKFYAVYIGSLVLAALAMLIPNLPLNLMSIITQVVGGILMAPLLIFLVLMTSDKKLMGEYRTKVIRKNMGMGDGRFADRIDSSHLLADVH